MIEHVDIIGSNFKFTDEATVFGRIAHGVKFGLKYEIWKYRKKDPI